MSPIDRLPEYWVSIDPGDTNVGRSVWRRAVCTSSGHTDPDSLVDWLVEQCASGSMGLVVYEAFNLRGAVGPQQVGSEFLTSQLIGAVRHICRRAGVPCVGFRPSDHKSVMRRPEFRPPKRAQREWASYGHGPHAKDSEVLGEYYVRRVLLRGRGY